MSSAVLSGETTGQSLIHRSSHSSLHARRGFKEQKWGRINREGRNDSGRLHCSSRSNQSFILTRFRLDGGNLWQLKNFSGGYQGPTPACVELLPENKTEIKEKEPCMIRLQSHCEPTYCWKNKYTCFRENLERRGSLQKILIASVRQTNCLKSKQTNTHTNKKPQKKLIFCVRQMNCFTEPGMSVHCRQIPLKENLRYRTTGDWSQRTLLPA